MQKIKQLTNPKLLGRVKGLKMETINILKIFERIIFQKF